MKKTMKYILGIIASCLMIWSLLDKENQEYKVYVQAVGVVLFFYVMMKLMEKTPSKSENLDSKDNLRSDDENEDME